MAKGTTHTKAPTNHIHSAPAAPAASPARAPASGPVSELKPSTDQIRRRAFEVYQDRVARGIRGDAATDWQQAERELAKR